MAEQPDDVDINLLFPEEVPNRLWETMCFHIDDEEYNPATKQKRYLIDGRCPQGCYTCDDFDVTRKGWWMTDWVSIDTSLRRQRPNLYFVGTTRPKKRL